MDLIEKALATVVTRAFSMVVEEGPQLYLYKMLTDVNRC